jgi:hypothetical protein
LLIKKAKEFGTKHANKLRDFTPTPIITDYNVHLCYTNEERIKINDVMMKHGAINYERGKSHLPNYSGILNLRMLCCRLIHL